MPGTGKSDFAVRTAGGDRVGRLLLLLVLALAALIQFTVVSRTEVDTPLRADAGDYFSYAYNLRNHGVYSATHPTGGDDPAPLPDRLRAPGYPLFLALLGAPEPSEQYLRRIALAQAALGVLSVLLAYLLAASFLDRGAALAVALLTAISPHLATISTYVLTESLFFFLLLASVLSLVKALDSGRRGLYVATGLLWGACSLVRPTAQFLPPLLLLMTLLLPALRAYRRPALLAFACFALVLAPWLIRNRMPAVQAPQSSLTVLTLLHGSYPGFMYDNQPRTFGFPYRFDPQADAASRDLGSVLRHIGRRFAAQPARHAAWYLLGKPVYFLAWGNVQGWDVLIYPVLHSPWFEDPKFVWLRLLAYALHWPLMILGLAGALLAWWRPGWLGLGPRALLAARLVSLVVAYAIAFHMVVAPFPRYGIPFRALLYALAMLPLRAAWLARGRPVADTPAGRPS